MRNDRSEIPFAVDVSDEQIRAAVEKAGYKLVEIQ